MSDIFEEVDEELRHDRLYKLWKQYGSLVIVAAVAVVAATGGYVWWRNHHIAQLRADGDAFVQDTLLRNAGQLREAADAFAALAARAPNGVGTLARLNQAAALANHGEAGKAVKIYDEIANTASDSVLRDLAVVCSASLSLDSADPAELKAKLKAVSGSDSPFRHSARELSALLALRTGDKATARELFKELAADKTAPSGLRKRAEEMLQALI